MMHWALLSALFFYSLATSLIVRQIRGGLAVQPQMSTSFYLAGVAVLIHALLVIDFSFAENKLNLSLPSMIVLVAWMTNIVFLLAGTTLPIRRLGVLVYPLTIISLVFAWAWPQSEQAMTVSSGWLAAHIAVALLSYAVLAIAVVQSLLHWYQESQLKARLRPTLLAALPPLQTMEQLWLRLVVFGFCGLSLTLTSGALFSRQLFGRAFMFDHHTVLAMMAWLVFAVLLYKRQRTGLRGAHAVLWTVAGFGFIQLGYFGTKIVSELLELQ